MKKMRVRVTAIVLALGMTALCVPSVAGQTALAAEQSSYVLAENNNETDTTQQEQVLEGQNLNGGSTDSESSEAEAISQEVVVQDDSENNNDIETNPDSADVDEVESGTDTTTTPEVNENNAATGNAESEDASAEDAVIAVSAASISLENASVTGIKDQIYTGSEIRQAISVTVNGKTLSDGTDYVVSYSNNINPGTATLTIEGKGNYTGILKKNFQIQNAKPVLSTISNSDAGVTITWKPVKGASKYRF